MKKSRKTRSSPKQERVRERLVKLIDGGSLSGMLPGVHQLSKDFGVNFQTLNKALDQLEQQKVLSRIPNMGTFVRQKNRIGLLAPNMPRAFLETPVFAKVVFGVERELGRMGKTMVHWQSLPTEEQVSNDVDGIIIFLHATETLDKKGMLDRVPCVRIMGLIDNTEKWDHITYDNSAIGTIAANYLLSKGHKDCAYIGPDKANPVFAGRSETFKSVIRSSGGSVWEITDEHLEIVSEDMNMVNRKRMLETAKVLASRKPRPTGLFVPADMFACVLYGALSEVGIRPGKDIQVVSCNNEKSFLMGLHPQPAVIDIHSEEIGRQAANRLLWRICHGGEPCEKILLKPELIIPNN